MRTRGTAVVIGLALLASACGGSSYKGLSKADFIKQADAICTKYNTLATAATKDLNQNSSQAELIAAIRTKLVPLFAQQQTELRKLKPPKEDRATVKQMIDDAQAAADDINKNTEKFLAGNGSTVLTEKSDKEETAYGLKECPGNGSNG